MKISHFPCETIDELCAELALVRGGRREVEDLGAQRKRDRQCFQKKRRIQKGEVLGETPQDWKRRKA